MPKAILEFNLPREKVEFVEACNAGKYYSYLWNIDQHCRSVIKYGHKYENVEDFAQYLRQMMPNWEEE